MNYSEYQNQPSSEKLVLAILYASQRLMGWTLDSGSIYKLQNFDVSSIVEIKDSGTAYTEVFKISDVTASKFYNDRVNKILYLRTTGSDNPNSRFLVLTRKLFFSNAPITLPHDLASGTQVYFEPMLKSTSAFGVEIDTIKQMSEAIEGIGTLTLYNDQSFWPDYFDRLYFENQPCYIYSYNRNLDPTEAQLIYKGLVEKKAYTTETINFSLKDILSELRSPLALAKISELGLRTGNDMSEARQRMILGRVFGHVPVNTDRVLDGYPVTGTVSISFGSATLNGTGTAFLNELSPDDRVVLDGVNYTVASITSDTVATLTENYAKPGGLTGGSALLIPDQPKRFINRTWKVAGHALREPITTLQNGSKITRLIVASNADFYPDDWIYVGTLGSGELVQVDHISGTKIINLRTSLASIPPIGTQVLRPAIQNVRIDDVALVYYQDYTFDASTAVLTLRTTAESNSAPIRNLTSNLTFTSGSRTVTAGTGLKNIIKPGYMVGITGNAVFFEVSSVDSDTQLTLKINASFTATANGRYKSLVFNEDDNKLSLDVLGRTEDGTTSGAFLINAPSLVKALLTDAGLGSQIDTTSFTDAKDFAPMNLGLVLPTLVDDQDAPIFRDVINRINSSVFGSLIQTSNFELAYVVLQPEKTSASLRLDEADILKLSFESTAEEVVKTSIVRYKPKEYDYLSKQSSNSFSQKTSDIATYLAKNTRERTFESCLVETSDAERYANRWAFILESGAGKAKIDTKLQGMRLEVGSIVEVNHRKFFRQIGLTDKSRLFLVEAVRKSGTDVTLDLVDLSNAFARVAAINTLTNDHSQSSQRDKLFGGFITDQYGLIDNDPDSFGTNLIW